MTEDMLGKKLVQLLYACYLTGWSVWTLRGAWSSNLIHG